MRVEALTDLAKKSIALLVFLGLTTAQVCVAQTVGDGRDNSPRMLELLDAGYKLPIEIVAVRNLQRREHWVRDLELEIKNVSTKPIYEVYFTLFFPDDKSNNGASYGVNLQYGRIDLIHPTQRPSIEDKPLGPGETVVLKVSEGLWRGYEYHLRSDNVPEQASYSVRLTILAVNFGEGTGFINGGVPYPRETWMKSRPQRYVRVPGVNPKNETAS